MACHPYRGPDGVTGIICTRGRAPKPKQCAFCKARDADLLCDAELKRIRHPRKNGSTTCDAAICHRCASEIGPDKHLCPKHREQTRAPQQGVLL